VDGDCLFTRITSRSLLSASAKKPAMTLVMKILSLRATGLEVFIFSGDRQAKVDAMSRVPRPPAGELPRGSHSGTKSRAMRELDARDTLYLGDGANDSLAFDAA